MLRRNANCITIRIASFILEGMRKWKQSFIHQIQEVPQSMQKCCRMNYICRHITLKGAKQKVPAGAEVIYLGWIMAGKIKGYSKASGKYNIKAENLNEIIRWYNRQK